jgi:ABC-type nitrate/sulfonate/bicarbonate transport system permease component
VCKKNLSASVFNKKNVAGGAYSFFAAFFFLFIWHLLCVMKIAPAYMLPSPGRVLAALAGDFPLLVHHLSFTLFEAFTGLCISIVCAFLIALLMDSNIYIKKILNPVLVLTQTLPVIALAPVLVLWLGYGPSPKIALVFMTCFFPMAVSLSAGLASTDGEDVLLMKSFGASSFDIYRFLKIPRSLPYFFSSLKISASYAVVGAVIAEWLGGNGGIGVYMIRVRKSYAFDKMFASIALIVIFSFILLKIVSFFEYIILPWNKFSKRTYPKV